MYRTRTPLAIVSMPHCTIKSFTITGLGGERNRRRLGVRPHEPLLSPAREYSESLESELSSWYSSPTAGSAAKPTTCFGESESAWLGSTAVSSIMPRSTRVGMLTCTLITRIVHQISNVGECTCTSHKDSDWANRRVRAAEHLLIRTEASCNVCNTCEKVLKEGQSS